MRQRRHLTRVSAGGGPGAGAVALYDDRVGVLFDDGSWHAAAPTDVLAMSRLSDATLVADPHSLQADGRRGYTVAQIATEFGVPRR